MKVVLLSTKPELVSHIFKNHLLVTQDHNGPIPECDFVVSYGHRYILKPEVIQKYQRRIINVHWGYLPWNKGSDPNLWAWYDDTPHGVTVHHIDNGLDTGPIILQLKVRFHHPEYETLETSYKDLQKYAVYALSAVWQWVEKDIPLPALSHVGPGSYHRLKDRESIVLPAGWRTPVEYVQDLGRWHRGESRGC